VLVCKQKLCCSLSRWLGSVLFLLSFSSSCLVKLLPQWGVVRCGSLSLHAILRFRTSALSSTSCPALEVAFCCACLLGTCLFALPPFSGTRSMICQPPPCCQCVVMVHCLFCNFSEPVWLWVLLTGSGDYFCGPLPTLLQAVTYPPPAVGLSAFPVICLLIVQTEIGSVPPSLSSVLSEFLPPLLCARFQFVVYCSIFLSFFFWGGQSPQGDMLVFPRGGRKNITWCLVLTCLVYQMSP
jgi:hypothetical protein